MSMRSRKRAFLLSLAVSGLSACAAMPEWAQPLTSQQTEAVREACDFLQPRSRIRSSQSPGRRTYSVCKRQALDEFERQ